VDVDISMDIHEKSVDMNMDMDVIFHIHGNPGKPSVEQIKSVRGQLSLSSFQVDT